MGTIMLNDLLHFDQNSNDYKFGKFIINTDYKFGKTSEKALNTWLFNNHNCDFAFSIFKEKGIQKNLGVGNLVIILAQMEDSNTYVLLEIDRITKVNYGKPIERIKVEEYSKYFGKIIVKINKKINGFCLKISTLLEYCAIYKVLDKEYSGKAFPGLLKLKVNLKELINYTTNDLVGEDWKLALSSINAIYCLNNHKVGKVYIGSSFCNKSCLYKNWEDYFTDSEGNKSEINKLKKVHGSSGEYFLNNFYFSILEIFSVTVDKNTIKERENYWIDVFNSRNSKQGYNRK